MINLFSFTLEEKSQFLNSSLHTRGNFEGFFFQQLQMFLSILLAEGNCFFNLQRQKCRNENLRRNMEFLISSFECRMQHFNGIMILQIQKLHLIFLAQTNCLPKLLETNSETNVIAKKYFSHVQRISHFFVTFIKSIFSGYFFQ